MSTLACTCPAMPECGPRDPIPTDPVRCVCCGHPLELSCAEKCGKVAESIAAAAGVSSGVSAFPAEKHARAKETKPRIFADRLCACGRSFTPHWSGDKRCPACAVAKGGV